MQFPFASHFVQAGDLKIHFMKEGQGEPLILLHGWPQTSYEWRHQIRLLSRHFTVYAPDNRGFGATEKPRIRITRDLLARDVLAFMDALGLESASLCGHDWGGIIAYKVAVTAPERIRRLCLIDTTTMLWPTWAAHAFWANLHPEPYEFLAKYSDELIAWCMTGKRPDYRDVVAPFPPDPLPGSETGWCDAAALRHYSEALADPGSHFATVQYYGSAMPMHRVIPDASGRTTFDYIGVHGAQAIWRHPGGAHLHPDLHQPLCYGPEDWNARYERPALFVYSPLMVPEAFGAGGWNPGYRFGGSFFEQSFTRPFPKLETQGIVCGHFIPEEAPDQLAAVLQRFFG
ncbi:MAG: alpha/beta fold hydrolase [Deltaproteobacteria bacterium]|nr:alpha/beta fold hydrolase [Deltaproteobacteria bacterium]